MENKFLKKQLKKNILEMKVFFDLIWFAIYCGYMKVNRYKGFNMNYVGSFLAWGPSYFLQFEAFLICMLKE